MISDYTYLFIYAIILLILGVENAIILYIIYAIIKRQMASPFKRDKLATEKVPESVQVRQSALVQGSDNLLKDFDAMGSSGDNAMVRKMVHTGNSNKTATDARHRFGKNTINKLFQDELDEHANTRWWDDETLDK